MPLISRMGDILPRVTGPLLCADAPALLYRAFFGLPDSITGAAGKPVNALLGSVNALLWCIQRYDPRVVVLCFGPESADYRVEAYPPYHAQRPPMPGALAAQWDRAPALYRAFGWTVVDADDVEADDLLHSLAHAEAAAGGTALILTGDRDLYQCVGDGVAVLMRGEVVDAAEVERRYGIPPGLVPDFIALRGDPSDGIPGAKGIGEKGAADLLRRHGSLEAALAGAVREQRPSVRRALVDQADELRMFRDLALLRDVPVELPADTPTDVDAGAAAAREIGMGRLAERLGSA
jgi:DNA polymerase-1